MTWPAPELVVSDTPITELDVRREAQRYGMWFGAGQGLFVGVLVTCLVHAAGAPCVLAWVTLMVLAGGAWARWRRSWRVYRASYMAKYEQERRELEEQLTEQKRWLAEIEGAVAKATGAEH